MQSRMGLGGEGLESETTATLVRRVAARGGRWGVCGQPEPGTVWELTTNQEETSPHFLSIQRR